MRYRHLIWLLVVAMAPSLCAGTAGGSTTSRGDAPDYKTFQYEVDGQVAEDWDA
jgi:hypothetical protein